jgi:hypothetical protein
MYGISIAKRQTKRPRATVQNGNSRRSNPATLAFVKKDPLYNGQTFLPHHERFKTGPSRFIFHPSPMMMMMMM